MILIGLACFARLLPGQGADRRGELGVIARLRADGIEVFVPHENALAAGDTSAATIFAKDWQGLSDADAGPAEART